MIADFYDDREIFFTGGSGVVGKAAIEKLLRTCNVKRIYILLRHKRGVPPAQRLEDIKKSRIFNVLNGKKPNELNKLSIIVGDTGLDGLGISPEDRDKLQNVSIFFHAAATVRFNEPLLTAIRYNLKSTVECLKLAETLPRLSMFNYVSTFFSNPYLKYVENKMYPAVFDWRVALKLIDLDVSEEILDTMTDKLINGFPNTYLFTKHLAEQVVNEYRFKFPVCIFRPSIVINALDEPEPGFTESTTGIMGFFLVWGAGLMQIMCSREGQQLDICPLDYSSKTLLIFTAQAAQLPREKLEERIPIAIASSQCFLALEMGKHAAIITEALHEFPFQKSIWIPSLTMTSSPFIYYIGTLLLQVLPSLLLDCLLRLAGQKPFVMAIQRKIWVTMHVLWFFMNNDYQCDIITDFEKFERAARGTELSVSGVPEWGKDLAAITASTKKAIHGCRKYLMNEDDSSLVQARRMLKFKKLLYNCLRAYVLYLILRRLYRMGVEYLDY